MTDDTQGRKVAFVVAIVGVILAAASSTPLHSFLTGITLDLVFVNCSLLTLAHISLGFLVLSLYCYALDFVRYGFKTFGTLGFFRLLQHCADFFYLIAIISPIGCFTIHLLVKLVKYTQTFAPDVSQIIPLVPATISVITALLTFILTRRQSALWIRTKEELLDRYLSESIAESQRLIDNKLWRPAVTEAFRQIELSMNKNVFELGLDPKKLPFHRVLQLMKQRGILNEDDIHLLMYVRELRNKAIHTTEELTESDAKEATSIIRRVSERLDAATLKRSDYEEEVIALLSDPIKGLFPSKRISIEKVRAGRRFDARATGPGTKLYLIEVKFRISHSRVKAVLQEMREAVSDREGVRCILIVPNIRPKFEIVDDHSRFLYYDSLKHLFENREEVLAWICNPEQKNR